MFNVAGGGGGGSGGSGAAIEAEGGFRGGGTRFPTLAGGPTFSPAKGAALVHGGKRRHGAAPVVGGERYVLAFFFEEVACQAQELVLGTAWFGILAWALHGTIGPLGAAASCAAYLLFYWSPSYVLNAFALWQHDSHGAEIFAWWVFDLGNAETCLPCLARSLESKPHTKCEFVWGAHPTCTPDAQSFATTEFQ